MINSMNSWTASQVTTLRWCGLKFAISLDFQPHFLVTTLRWCGLKCHTSIYLSCPHDVTTLRWCGLKCLCFATCHCHVCVTTLWWCGLKFRKVRNVVCTYRSPPCGGVDWNCLKVTTFAHEHCHHLAVVWIEIAKAYHNSVHPRVTTLRWCGLKWHSCIQLDGQGCHHLAVVWIEIREKFDRWINTKVTTLRWCGLK